MLSNALKSSTPRVIIKLGYEHEITFFFRFMIHYVIDNEEEAEDIYREERAKYEKVPLGNQLQSSRKKSKGQRI